MMTEIIFYSRQGCHLCEKAKHELLELKKEIDFSLEEKDIAESDELTERYGLMIPVVVIDGDEAGYGQISIAQVSKRLQEKNRSF